MKVLLTAVGRRVERWTDLFAALCRRGDVQLTLALTEVSDQTREVLSGYLTRWPDLRYHLLPHLLAESRTGRATSVMFRPGAARQLGDCRPDIVHILGEAAYLTTRQVIGWRDRLWPYAPITLHATQNVATRLPAPLSRLERHAYPSVRHAFPITPAALDTLRAKGYRGPATIVPPGVDTTVFTPAPRPIGPRRFTVGYVGSLEPHKGVPDLLRAAERLNCDLIVVGRGSLTGAVRQAARRRPGQIELRAWAERHELPALMARMDALVLPSVEVPRRNLLPWRGPSGEQFGRVLLEAMACAVPVVGSDAGEIPYVIGDCGLTFPAGDVPALCGRLADLRDDPMLTQRLREDGARRAVTEFGWHRVAESMREVWVDLLAPYPAVDHARRVPRPVQEPLLPDPATSPAIL